MVVDDILQAASALCLSPRKDRSKRAPFDLIAGMPRGQKRSRREPSPAETSIGNPPSPSKLPKFNDDRAGLAHDPILISDSDDDDTANDRNAIQAMLREESEEEEQQQKQDDNAEDDDDDDESSGTILRQSLAKRFLYESPTKKARAARKPVPKPESTITEPSLLSTSSIELPPMLKTDMTSSSKLSPKTERPASKKSKAAKPKAKVRTTINLKKTREAAEQAGIAPLDLERVPSGGFRLILRCSFCAEQFTKSASAVVKQEHLALCAPLQGIKRSAPAVETIVSDIQSALHREKLEEKKASDERTVLQDVMHNADIIQHEGRASQIATSPKKRGKDKVVVKKAVKRSTKASLLIAQDPLAGPSFAPRPPVHNLLPARKAMQAARDTAIGLLGSALSFKAESSKSEQDDDEALEPEADDPPSDLFAASDLPSTPKKTHKKFLPQTHHADLDDSDGVLDTPSHLPIVSAEQVFASMASSNSSPHKSPVKALQKSRERQISREQEQSLAADGIMPSPRSPVLPQTQPFAPSKLAQRRQTRDGSVREKLFGAETTTRSLLDLVQDRQGDYSRETPCESKRKADEDDEVLQGADTKRAKLASADADAEHESVPLDDDAMYDDDAMHDDDAIASHVGSSDDQDMDVDEQLGSTSQSDTIGRSGIGELQAGPSVKAISRSANRTAGTDQDDEQDPFHIQQTTMILRSDQHDHALIDADSLDEDLAEEDDDDEDTQSFLDLLEPSEVIHEPVFSPTHSLSDPSSADDMDEPDAMKIAEAAHRSRRMLVACGGASITTEYRRKGDIPFPSSQKPSLNHTARESSVSNSDPDLVLITDGSCEDSNS